MSPGSTLLEDGDRAAAGGDWPRAVACWIESDSLPARQRLRWLLDQVDGDSPRAATPLPRLPLLVMGGAGVVAAGLLAAGYRSASWWVAIPIWIAILVTALAAIWFAWRAGSLATPALTASEIARARDIATIGLAPSKHEHHPS